MALLLVVIYITFISLGLPDSLFGVSWPLVHADFGVAESLASAYSVIVALTTGGMSFFAGPLLQKFGTGKVTAISVALTVVSLFGISFAPNLWVMLLFSVIGGLGAGAIDTGLNHYVSVHCKAIHMNWLHCFWGVGVTVSPLIMSLFLKDGAWQAGYRTIGYIQLAIMLLVFASLPLWKKHDTQNAAESAEETEKSFTLREILSTKGVVFAILTLGLYSAMESLVGTWGASYLVNDRNFTPDVAANYVSLYYGGIMFGRFLSGLVSLKMKDEQLIRVGLLIAFFGILTLFIPADGAAIVGLFLAGLGFAPIFPSILHAVPKRFGVEKASYITGFQMGGAYAIGFSLQVIFGLVATSWTFSITPFVLSAVCLLTFFTNETTNQKVSHSRTANRK